MQTMMDLELWREHRAQMRREVESERLARLLRTNGRQGRAHGFWKRAIHRWAVRGVAWVGKAALFCLGLMAMLALVIIVAVLTPVMLMATALPAPVVRRKRDLRGRRHGGHTSEFSAPRKAVSFQGQQGQ